MNKTKDIGDIYLEQYVQQLGYKDGTKGRFCESALFNKNACLNRDDLYEIYKEYYYKGCKERELFRVLNKRYK